MAVDNYQPAEQTLVPIVRQSGAILSAYNKNSNSLYNNLSPYINYGFSIGPKQPFVYIKPSDSTFSRNLTKYDNPAFPIGSTVRDLNRIGQFSVTGTGILFYGKQLLLQQQNAFNETRVYNPLSVLKATAKPGSTGLIDYPQRHLETSGGLLNFFKDAVMSTLGLQAKNTDNAPIEGTATGAKGALAWSTYAGLHGGAKAGLIRFNTGNTALTNFNRYWVASMGDKKESVGFMAGLGNAFVNKLKSMIPSTNPMGAFGKASDTKWEYRPEYPTGEAGAYHQMLDANGILRVSIGNDKLISRFYNGIKDINRPKNAFEFHNYYPTAITADDKSRWYASPKSILDENIKDSLDGVGRSQSTAGKSDTRQYAGINQKTLYSRYLAAIEPFNEDFPPQGRRSMESYTNITDKFGKKYPSYKEIPSGDIIDKFESQQESKNTITVNKMGFAKTTVENSEQGYLNRDGSDKYNSLDVLSDKKNLINPYDPNQSADVIFFYFHDLINDVYIPFRATISSLNDQHSAEWEDISYLGRADKLFLYKGFSRDVNLSFTVYANSIKELIPMWKRINYFVGLTRPSKYTGMAVVTREPTKAENEARATFNTAIQSAQTQQEIDQLTNGLNVLNEGLSASGRESRFIYPPMITMRVGDLFVDQPCVLSSIGLSIPDDAVWENYRADNDYSYLYNPAKTPIKIGAKSRQLPTKADISISVKMLEKERSLGSADHYGFNMGISEG